MKQLIIILLLIIAIFIGYGKYSQYKRYNAPEINYKSAQKIDLNYHNQQILYNYYEAIEDLNSFVMLQWTANSIDVRTPEDDNTATQTAVKNYAKKLAKVRYFEAILANSFELKNKGLSNKAIKQLEEVGIDLKTQQQKAKFERIKRSFTPNTKLYNGEKNSIIFEVQKRLVALGDSIEIDGVYRAETLNAIKNFEAKNNLMADGLLDVLTLETLFK